MDYYGIGIMSLVFPFLILFGILAFFARDKKRGYTLNDYLFYILSFFSLAILYISLSDLLRILLQIAIKDPQRLNGYYSIKSEIPIRLSALIVSIPLYIFSWKQAVKDTSERLNELKKTYVTWIILLSVLTLIPSVIFVLGGFIGLGIGVSGANLTDIILSLPSILVATAVLAVHFRFRKKLLAK
ncbi:hypothetical protein A2961_00535 [Candidatus Woesebacteria bacterium RIFCSPLOWO2_01_FULL_39_21]|uniref:DUF5671 domain-containing protein n=1 Tax=Candidatus Woesebacteria bacterium RIFCSPLOWO2_01_FULL_39_21 TaxID=1802519 RepID=A0A1F8BDL8_9BACT|nr:MAG: hypothetical protein A2691_01095 [Candidatus Woesebacteria bacterium RIFCSPHIGHO2_01_FULL_39_23]OGM61475.1 MAG: hypothetical protein A2961_00535 [Candidatus Woesebacteria bacterium RIFCSPLOWO2_01_FULL_39_21]